MLESQVLQEEQLNIMDTDIVPFGIIDDGLDPLAEKDASGDYWTTERGQLYPFDDLNYNWTTQL